MPMSTAAGSGVPSGAPLLRVVIAIWVLGLTAGVLIGMAAATSYGVPAPGGTVEVGQTCGGWSARVELNHKVSPFRTVNVVSTIPGHPGIVDGTFDSSFGLIWLASGSEHDVSGTVTLRISAGTNPIFEASATLIPAVGCDETTTTTTTGPTATTEPTLPVQGRQDPQPEARVRDTFPETGGNGWLFAVGAILIGVGLEAILWARRAR